ncbi:protein phosphatase 1, regulatory subunit 3Da [Hypanus sabinus]|uniref:protein phosphatase 1, regulatory subunit 3Da n=1 Tax=Hypanus sabinus TaxID=79690 RepID=UPI0028C3A2DA|nr:protein phosphatase 1, regulatory subunit 3Da [Hypanus sabinus]
MNLAPDPRTGSVMGLKLKLEVGVQGKAKSFPPLQHNLSATGLKEWVKLAPFQDLRSGWDKKLEQCLQLPLLVSRTSSQQKLPLESQDMGSSDFTPDVGLEQQIYITLSQSLGPFSGLCVRVQLMHGLGYPLGPSKRDWGAWPKVRRRAKSCPGSLTKRQGSIRSNRSSSSSNRVRFADSVGLELTEVRSFDSAEEPIIPAHVLASFSSNEPTEQVIWIQRFRMEFTNPKDDENFSERLNNQKVCLEAVSGAELVISGTILVINLAYHKEVTVRFTCNDWKFFTDVSALFESNIESKMDRFTFTLNPSIHLLQPGCSLQFAIKYKVEELEFWDNNRGSNYKMTYQSLQVTAPNDNADRTVDFN